MRIGIINVLRDNSPNCPNCGAGPEHHEVRNYDPMWQDGDVVCTKCETKVRDYDAG